LSAQHDLLLKARILKSTDTQKHTLAAPQGEFSGGVMRILTLVKEQSCSRTWWYFRAAFAAKSTL